MRALTLVLLAACGGSGDGDGFTPTEGDSFGVSWSCELGCDQIPPDFAEYGRATAATNGWLVFTGPCATCGSPMVAYDIEGDCITAQGLRVSPGVLTEPWSACALDGVEALRGTVLYEGAEWTVTMGYIPEGLD